jgi:hypothetical protein
MADLQKLLNAIIATSAARNPQSLANYKSAEDLSGISPKARRIALLVKYAAAEAGPSIMEKVMDAVQHNRAVQVGLGSALLGGGMAALAPRKQGEGLGRKTLRVLGNAAVAGGLGAGATAALGYGSDQIATALPKGDVDPITNATHSPVVRGIGALVGAGAGHRYGLGSGGKSPADVSLQSLVNKVRTATPGRASAIAADDPVAWVRGLQSTANSPFKALQTELGGLSSGKNFDPTVTRNTLDRFFHGQPLKARDILTAENMGVPNADGVLDDLNDAGVDFGKGLKERASLFGKRHLNRFKSKENLKHMGGSLARVGGGAAAGYFAPEIGDGIMNMLGVHPFES